MKAPKSTLAPGKLPKTHQGYWAERLEKRTYPLEGGKVGIIEEFQVRMQHKRRREWFPLASSNKVTASKRAAEIYQYLRVQGWDETIKRYKGLTVVKKKGCTVGEFLDAVEQRSHLSTKTFANYARWIRTMIAQLKEIPDTVKKYDHRGGGVEQWRKKIDSVPLDFLTPEKVRRWQKLFLAKAGNDPLAIRKAEHSVNSAIRNARSLFSKKILFLLNDMELPSPLPFADVDLVKSGSMRYLSEVDVGALVQAAKAELHEAHPEEFKIFLLSLFAGLRRNEIDKLLWKSVDLEGGTIRVEPNQHFSPKTETSIGNVPINPAVVAYLKDFKEGATSEFVLESRVKAKPGAAYAQYRAEKHFQNLIEWLRAHSIKTSHPLHTLRKEYGRLLTEKHGIYAASKALRHASIQITAAHYADDTRRVMVTMDDLG